jgi:hypothetical protein
MSISGISSGSVAAAYTPPPAQQVQQAPAPQKAATADTVSISKLAQQLASDGDTMAKESSESGAEKAGETIRGKA